MKATELLGYRRVVHDQATRSLRARGTASVQVHGRIRPGGERQHVSLAEWECSAEALDGPARSVIIAVGRADPTLIGSQPPAGSRQCGPCRAE